ncbi:hypothetical protein [Ruminococcus flavefaciens]|uniref:PH domain-containing protein n=1 Tax=Ruminococcus flavefaciens TaxID=1265 RepID=A0A1M7MF92_RUMFL|nr:hypothetical protein [Ruminococcus flavefaciens]SHM89444.1 hypothetical protein SAMN04487860_1228 [Ruminococcus flavefaciens]
MFGRRRDEDYDAYNEKYSAKYDDDYIAPSEEYRSECDHDHEQTYEDITDVRECDHSHEQTYDDITNVRDCDHDHEQTYADADREQHPYDNYVSLESRFEPLLMPNEHLLWTGGKDPAQKAKNNSAAAGGIMLVISLILMCTVVLSVVGIIMLVISISMMSGSTVGLYGVTDKRVIIIYNSEQLSVPLENIKRVNAIPGANNGKGYITLVLTNPIRGRSNKNSNIVGMYNISDTKRVARIIEDAIHGALMNK